MVKFVGSAISTILCRKNKYKLKINEVIYDFIDKVAYFTCTANILVENYIASDGELFYEGLMGKFQSVCKFPN